MRMLQENPNATLRSVKGMMAETNLSRFHLMQIAESAGAVVRYGTKGIRINQEVFFSYLERGQSDE